MTDSRGFAIIGDSHIIADEDPLKITNRYDSLYALEQVVDWCLANQYDLVIAGDLFDKNLVPSHLLKDVTILLNRLTVRQRLLGIQGNHDKNPSYPWFMHDSKAEWLHQRPTVVAGHRLVGLDFAPSAVISQQLTTIQPCDGLILHQALQQGLGFDGAWNCDLDWVPEHAPNVWIGDLHNIRHELFSTSKAVRAVYTTSQYMTKVDESEHPSFLAVPAKTGSSRFVDYQRIPLQHRPVLRLTIDNEQQLDQMVDQVSLFLLEQRPGLPEAVRRPSLVVTYYADITGVLETLRSLTDDFKQAAVNERSLPSRQSTFATRRITVQAREGLTLHRLISERTDGQFQQFLLDLASCPTTDVVRQTISAWRSRVTTTKEVV